MILGIKMNKIYATNAHYSLTGPHERAQNIWRNYEAAMQGVTVEGDTMSALQSHAATNSFQNILQVMHTYSIYNTYIIPILNSIHTPFYIHIHR